MPNYTDDDQTGTNDVILMLRVAVICDREI